MTDYNVIGIDLAKTKFHIAAINAEKEMTYKKAIKRDDFFEKLLPTFPSGSHFAMEAFGGAHYVAQ